MVLIKHSLVALATLATHLMAFQVINWQPDNDMVRQGDFLTVRVTGQGNDDLQTSHLSMIWGLAPMDLDLTKCPGCVGRAVAYTDLASPAAPRPDPKSNQFTVSVPIPPDVLPATYRLVSALPGLSTVNGATNYTMIECNLNVSDLGWRRVRR